MELKPLIGHPLSQLEQEFVEELQNEVIDPIEKAGAEFLGMSSLEPEGDHFNGAYLLVFKEDDDKDVNRDAIPKYETEICSSTIKYNYGYIYYLIVWAG